MKLGRDFEYIRAHSVNEVTSLLSSYGEDARILAGGTDLGVQIKKRLCSPKYLVDIKNIEELGNVKDTGESLDIGPLVCVAELEQCSAVSKGPFSVLKQASHNLGSYQVRNRATVGGNICNASPSAELAPPLIALGALVEISSPQGTRTVELEDFFLGPGSTVLRPGEMVVSITVPKPKGDLVASYLKLAAKRTVDIAVANVCVVLGFTEDKAVQYARVVLGSVAPTPIRAVQAERALEGWAPLKDSLECDNSVIREASALAMEECSPIMDLRASAEYRRAMVGVLVSRACRVMIPSVTRSG